MDLIIYKFKNITINRLSSKISSTYRKVRQTEDDENESSKLTSKSQKRNKFQQDIDIKA